MLIAVVQEEGQPVGRVVEQRRVARSLRRHVDGAVGRVGRVGRAAGVPAVAPTAAVVCGFGSGGFAVVRPRRAMVGRLASAEQHGCETLLTATRCARRLRLVQRDCV